MKIKELFEKINLSASLRPAIRVNGKIYASQLGSTHMDAISMIPDIDIRKKASLDSSNRGFVNEKGRFLSRDRALQYALENDLIDDRYKHWFMQNTYAELSSEILKKS